VHRIAIYLRMIVGLGLAAWTLGAPGALQAIHLLPVEAKAAAHARAGPDARPIISTIASHDKSKPAEDLIDCGHDHSPSLSSLFAILASPILVEVPIALKPILGARQIGPPVLRGADPPTPRPPSSI